jgi:uncharacterized RDD family membrane protein YckC
MSSQTLFVLVMAVAALNGLLHLMTQSGLILLLLIFAPVWWPEVFGFHVAVLAWASSLIIATATLMLGGIPAALYERLRGQQSPSPVSMGLWLAGAITIAIVMAPTLAMRPGG